MATDRQNARRFSLVAGVLAALALLLVVFAVTMGSCQEPDNRETITAPEGHLDVGPDGAPGVE